jgi:hypothetical protein
MNQMSLCSNKCARRQSTIESADPRANAKGQDVEIENVKQLKLRLQITHRKRKDMKGGKVKLKKPFLQDIERCTPN